MKVLIEKYKQKLSQIVAAATKIMDLFYFQGNEDAAVESSQRRYFV